MFTLFFSQSYGTWMFIPDPGSEFFHPGSQIQGKNDYGSRILIRVKYLKYF
jgi:hypothetical protein